MITRLRTWFRALFRRSRFEAHLVEEMESHIRQYAADLERSGMPSAEAYRKARLEFGNVHQLKLDCGEVRGAQRWGDLGRDVVVGWRWLRRSPGFAAAAIISIALGVGANAAVFTVLNALMLRPLPVADPQALVRLTPGGGRQTWTHPQWEELRVRQGLVAGIAAWSPREFDLASGGPTRIVQGLWVSGDFFEVLGIRPAAGRLLSRADDAKGGGPDGPTAVVSHRFWQREFGGAPDVVGRRLSVDRTPFTVVGVTPPGFLGPTVGRGFDIAIPIGTQARVLGRDRFGDRNWWWLSIVARLNAGERVDAVQTALRGEQAALREATMPANLASGDADRYLAAPIEAIPLADAPVPSRRTYQQPVIVLMFIVGVVLFIACLNVANLTLAKSVSRAQDLRVRLALGASTWRLMRQAIVESLLISGTGVAVGFILARLTAGVLAQQLSSAADPVVLDLAVDWRLVIFMVSLTTVIAIVIGLIPALSAARLRASLSAPGRGASAGPVQSRTAGVLATIQVALSLAMVVAAGLFVRTFVALTSRDAGFDVDRVIVVHVDAMRSTRPPRDRIALLDALADAARRTPGVAAAEWSGFTPVSNNSWDTIIRNPRGAALDEDARRVYQSLVGPDWFKVYGIPVVSGRAFAASDLRRNADVAIVNETFAARYFPGRSPLGETIQEVGSPGDPSWPLTIVGVVKDSLHLSRREVTPPMFYRPVTPAPRLPLNVRSTGVASAALEAALGRSLAAVDRDVALTIRPLGSEVGMSTVRERLLAWLAGVFGSIATAIAAVGFYGIAAGAAAARHREIAIRLALGAGPRSVVVIVASRLTLAVAIGVAAGVGLSMWASRFVGALLYGVPPHDPISIALAIAVMFSVGVGAISVPLRRALSADPARVLARE